MSTQQRMNGFVVAVCGGRDFGDEDAVFNALDKFSAIPSVTVVTGGARGADAIAEDLSRRFFNFKVSVEHADWEKLGNAAGPVRNQRILDTWHPDVLLAFPGGRGTRDMTERARTMGIPIRELG